MVAANTEPTQQMQIFRAADAPGLMEAKCMSVDPFTPVQRQGMDRLVAEGLLEGDEIKVLCNIPGFSLTYAWFKESYPLPLHSHDSDCLYYIIAGHVRLGSEDLGPKDSFFVPAGVPYTYKAGPGGVEVLEFRHAQAFNFVNLAKSEVFWSKAAETVAASREGWKRATPPSQRG